MEILIYPAFCMGVKMFFKTEKIRDEFYQAPMMLQMLACDIDKFTISNYGQEITLTRILGTVDGDSGVHKAFRAFDIRSEHLGNRDFTEGQIDVIIKWVNDRYKRSDSYETCIYHSFNGGPKHFHCQIPYRSFDLRGTYYKEAKTWNVPNINKI